VDETSDPHPAFHQRRVDVQNDPPHLAGPKRPNGQSHRTLGHPMNIPPFEPPGQIRQRVRPGNSLHPQKTQQARIRPQKVNIRQPIPPFDDHWRNDITLAETEYPRSLRLR